MKSAGRAVPQRTCVSCRQVRDKRGLVRIVQGVDGGVEVDPSWKKAGRGAYLCPRLQCWQGLKADRLGFALRTKVSPQAMAQLMEHARRTYGSS